MPRITPLTKRDEIAPEHGPIYDRLVEKRGSIVGPFRVLLHSPELADRAGIMQRGAPVVCHARHPVEPGQRIVAAGDHCGGEGQRLARDRQPAALRDLDDVGGEERKVEQQQRADHHRDHGRVPSPEKCGDERHQDGVDHHWGELFKAAVLTTILSVGSEAGYSGNESDIARALRQWKSNRASS